MKKTILFVLFVLVAFLIGHYLFPKTILKVVEVDNKSYPMDYHLDNVLVLEVSVENARSDTVIKWKILGQKTPEGEQITHSWNPTKENQAAISSIQPF